MFEARRVVVAGEAKIPDAPGGLLLPEPVYDAHLFGRIVAGFVQGMQQIEVDVVHTQPLELLLEDVFGLVEGLAAPQRQLGGEVEALPRPRGNDPAHERFALTAVVGESGVKVVDARLPGSVQQLFGPHFVDAAIWQGGKAHTPVAQQGGGDVPPTAVFFRPITILHSHFRRGSARRSSALSIAGEIAIDKTNTPACRQPGCCIRAGNMIFYRCCRCSKVLSAM